MTTQPYAIDLWLANAGLYHDDPITRDFWEFHKRNPQVYEVLVTLCRRAVSKRVTRIGIGMLWEVMRWELTLSPLPDPREAFKLNNNYRSRYARLIMATEPDLAGIFETRELRPERAP